MSEHGHGRGAEVHVLRLDDINQTHNEWEYPGQQPDGTNPVQVAQRHLCKNQQAAHKQLYTALLAEKEFRMPLSDILDDYRRLVAALGAAPAATGGA